jgi:glycine/D-amino acid oxidase-like deaminating enzyme
MPAKGDAKMRIVVVGAGILGASTAYHLARDGADVAIVDQAHEGQATAAGAGEPEHGTGCVIGVF